MNKRLQIVTIKEGHKLADLGEELKRNIRKAIRERLSKSSVAALMLMALALSNAPALAEAKKPTTTSSIPFEIESQVASQPLESVLPCKADEAPRAYTVMGPEKSGIHTVILCENGKYSAYTRTAPSKHE